MNSMRSTTYYVECIESICDSMRIVDSQKGITPYVQIFKDLLRPMDSTNQHRDEVSYENNLYHSIRMVG